MTKAINTYDQSNTINANDQIVIIKDPHGTPKVMLVRYGDLLSNVISIGLAANEAPPANSNVTGQTAGKLRLCNDGYLYYSSNTSHTVRMGPFVTF